MEQNFLPYAKQSIENEDILQVSQALQIDTITRGPPVQFFEEAVARYCGARYAVAFQTGTSALMAAYFAASFSIHDRVFAPPNTFIASVGIPTEMKIQPTWVDIDTSTGNLDLEKLKKHLEFQSTRGRPFIIPVHFSGIPVNMKALDQLIRHSDTVIIEDAAHAIGSNYPSGEKVGSCAYSQMTIFSFHPAKTITTGEGGMVTTNDEQLYHRLQLYRDNGIERHQAYLKNEEAPGYYEVHAITGNYNFTSFQAALGLSQLNRLEKFVEKRRSLVKKYQQLLKNIPYIQYFNEIPEDQQIGYHLFVIQIDFEAYRTTRTNVMKALLSRGIGTQVHYIPLYRHPIYNNEKGKDWNEEYPNAERYYARALSLPLYYDLTHGDVERVCQSLTEVLDQMK